MYISRLISILLLLVATASTTSISAQDKADRRMNRQEWFKQMRVYKHDFLIKDLGLSQEQQEKFFPLRRHEREHHEGSARLAAART